MSCPACGLRDPLDDGLCPDCVREGWEAPICGCLKAPNGWERCCEKHDYETARDFGDEALDILREDGVA
jgi:hypothetical protein